LVIKYIFTFYLTTAFVIRQSFENVYAVLTACQKRIFSKTLLKT